MVFLFLIFSSFTITTKYLNVSLKLFEMSTKFSKNTILVEHYLKLILYFKCLNNLMCWNCSMFDNYFSCFFYFVYYLDHAQITILCYHNEIIVFILEVICMILFSRILDTIVILFARTKKNSFLKADIDQFYADWKSPILLNKRACLRKDKDNLFCFPCNEKLFLFETF